MALIMNIIFVFLAGYWGLETLGYAVYSSGLWLFVSIPLLLFALLCAFNVFSIINGDDERMLMQAIEEHFEGKDADESSDT